MMAIADGLVLQTFYGLHSGACEACLIRRGVRCSESNSLSWTGDSPVHERGFGPSEGPCLFIAEREF